MRELIFQARKKDFKIERIRGSGPGGQHRNKTASCVRITHIESGFQEYCCESRCQHTNFKTAFNRLARRLVAHYAGKKERERYAAGTERIRTYHEPDDRVVDHRTGDKFSYAETIGKGDIEPIMVTTSRKLLGDRLG